MKYLRLSILPILAMTALTGMAYAEDAPVADDAVAETDVAIQDPAAAPELTPDLLEDNDPRAVAILAAIEKMSGMPEDQVSTAVAQVMVAFTAVTEPDEFLGAMNWWNAVMDGDMADTQAEDQEMAEIDANAVVEMMADINWISAGGEGPAVHYVMDVGCEPCVETLGALRALNDANEIELRLSILPLIEDETFNLAIGLYGDPDNAWTRFAAMMDEEIDATIVREAASDDNLDVQAAIEADYEAVIATDIRTLPLTGFRNGDGQPRIILGGFNEDEAREIILGS